MTQLPKSMPADGMSAYAYFLTVERPSIDDLTGMMFLEASGEALYEGLAGAAGPQEAKDILLKNGREERAHAHRLRRVLRRLTGKPVEVPSPDENPYHNALGFDSLTREVLDGLIGAEFDGDRLYNVWADSLDDPEAAKLLRLNGREERRHGLRLRKVMDILGA
ncbi:MAG: hypothetical protein GC201_03220 [Alphaproteobacteria bacterium]|nr:hypothetical protein [Alphaproteobacteria bacterium]